MTEEQNRWYKSLPVEKIKETSLKALPEYSLSDPTGTTIGKVWKRNIAWSEGPGHEQWVICEYVKHPDPKLVKIEERRPVLI